MAVLYQEPLGPLPHEEELDLLEEERGADCDEGAGTSAPQTLPPQPGVPSCPLPPCWQPLLRQSQAHGRGGWWALEGGH